MTDTPHRDGAEALGSLLDQRGRFGKLGERDFAAATEILVKKLMISAGQTTVDMRALRDTVGEEIFEKVLKSLSHHHARLLARRLDKSVPDIEVSTAGAACAWIRTVMDGTAPAGTAASAEETSPEETTPEDGTPAPKNAYFGRKAFRTGG